MRKFKALVPLLVMLFLLGCATNIQDLTTQYATSSVEVKNFARISAQDWLFGSGILQGALNEQMVPVWIFDELKKVDGWFEVNAELTDWQLGYMVGLRLRMASPIIKTALEQYAPGVLAISQVTSVLAFIGL